MNSFIMQKKIGEVWVKLPAQIIGGDASGTYPSIMDRFYGMVFNNARRGSYNLPPFTFYMPDIGDMTYSTTFTTQAEILSPIKLCVGYMRLENAPYFNEGEFQVQTSIGIDEQIIGTYTSAFTIENNMTTNFTWNNADGETNLLVIRSLNLAGDGKCFPVIFAIQDTDEFNNNYVVETAFDEIMVTYGLPAKWVKPINFENITKRKIEFTVNKEAVGEFNMPQKIAADSGSIITLPGYDELFYKNFIPLKWRINNQDYALGSKFTMPAVNVTAELIYDSKCYSGITNY